jgi:hypothetical protein
MNTYGDKVLVDKILDRVSKEGGHVELTETLTYGITGIKITNLYNSGKLKYNKITGEKVSPRESNLSSLHNIVLKDIIKSIEGDKFI